MATNFAEKSRWNNQLLFTDNSIMASKQGKEIYQDFVYQDTKA